MLRPDTLALTALLALLTAVGPMSVDLYLPSLPELGRVFGKNHTTVFAGVRSMEAQCARDPGLAEIVDLLVERFGEVEGREREQ